MLAKRRYLFPLFRQDKEPGCLALYIRIGTRVDMLWYTSTVVQYLDGVFYAVYISAEKQLASGAPSISRLEALYVYTKLTHFPDLTRGADDRARRITQATKVPSSSFPASHPPYPRVAARNGSDKRMALAGRDAFDIRADW